MRYTIWVIILFTCRMILAGQSVFNIPVQVWLYPWLVGKAGLPIPVVGVLGTILLGVGYIILTLPGWACLITATLIMCMGYAFSAPTSPTILSVCMENSPN